MKQSWVGKIIKIDRGGPESRTGMLLDVSDDHFVLLTEEDGVVYYNTQHIKSVTNKTNDRFKFDLEVPDDFDFVKADNFKGLLESLKYQWIQINRGGPEKIEGVLTETNDDNVTLVSKDEILFISLFHIRNISYGLKIEKAQEEKSQNQSNEEMDQSEKSQGRLRLSVNGSYEVNKEPQKQTIQIDNDELKEMVKNLKEIVQGQQERWIKRF